ncbi:MAG: panthothenate synthetase [Phycisphaera sp.]|nr:panthothenate synthetase [Phycisphaera sp.]
MRMLMKVTMPHGRFNAAIRDGSVDAKIQAILGELKPEAVYFTEFDGKRTGIVIVDITDASQIPSIAEPWFLTFDADVEICPAMVPEDLANAGLDKIAEKWA